MALEPTERAIPPTRCATPIHRPLIMRTGRDGLGSGALWAAFPFALLGEFFFLRPGEADRPGEVVRVAIVESVLLPSGVAKAFSARLSVTTEPEDWLHSAV